MLYIWVIGSDKRDLVQAQRQINEAGSMRAVCMLSFDAVKKMIETLKQIGTVSGKIPSLIIMDFCEENDYNLQILELLQNHPMLAGVPLAFMVKEYDGETEVKAYEQGATLVLHKPFTTADQIRMEKMAWQHDMTKEYEGLLQKQSAELKSAKEIQNLNHQLSRRNEVLNQLFGRYFSDELVEKILTRPEAAGIGGEKRMVTVMMADLRGFTAISEGMEAEALTDLLNCFFSEMIAHITEYHGTVIEILGDAILAVFGAINNSERQIEDGICAAIQMQNHMEDVNRYCEEKGYPHLEMGIGLHFGEVFVGNVGSEKMMRYNVIGEAVNLCSRIENYSAGGQVLASRSTIDKAGITVHVKNPMQIKVKGVKEPISICEITGMENDELYTLEHISMDSWKQLDRIIQVQMNPIQEKIVKEQSVVGILCRVSMKEAVIKMEIEYAEGFEPLMDVKLSAKTVNGDAIFENIYAKWVGCEKGIVTLHFTHLDETFRLWMKELEGSEVSRLDTNTCGFEQSQMVPIGYDKENAYWMEEYRLLLLQRDDEGKTEELHKQLLSYMAEQDISYGVEVCETKGNFYVTLFSRSSRSRALEFMYFLLKDSGLVKGNEAVAKGQVSMVMMDVLMQNAEVNSLMEYMMQRLYMYLTDCDEIESDTYAKEHAGEITEFPRYVKKKNGWSFVKTLDVAKEGQHIRLKSLENESGVDLVANADTYIMIGKLGEVYDISRENFEKTYEATDEPFDLFASMSEYIPAVELDDGEYINLDEYAYVCYPMNRQSIYAIPFQKRTKIFSAKRNDDYFYGEIGDYMAIRPDDFEDIYVIKKGVLESTYELEEG